MKLARPIRRHHPETIVALIDVVFFLLVFFMLIGRMDATAPFDVIPPLSPTGADLPAGGVTVAISATGQLALDGTEVTRADLPEAMRGYLTREPDILVRINAHHAAELRHVLPLVSEIEVLGARAVALVVTPNPP